MSVPDMKLELSETTNPRQQALTLVVRSEKEDFHTVVTTITMYIYNLASATLVFLRQKIASVTNTYTSLPHF
jgi:hypothetical protein